MIIVTFAIILVCLTVQFVGGNQRIVYVSELISDGEALFSSGDGDSNLMCCVYGNCTCNSLDYALINLISNVLINITTDVVLSSLISASNLENVSIIGYNDPTVKCKKAGGMHFNFCHNCIIQGITWDGCGREAEAGILLHDSSNIAIEKCTFQFSKGPAIVLSEVSGHVIISHCNFVHNNHYGGHGAVLHYSSSNIMDDFKLFLSVSNCNFTNNNATSLVYIENIIPKYNSNITFQNTQFYHNQGVSIYVVHQNVYLLEKVLFQNNTAEDGTGIYMKDHSTLILGKSSDVTFMQNFAGHKGGAVFLGNHSSIIFDQNSMTTFNDSNTFYGILYSEVNCSVIFQATCEVTFSRNSVERHGFAIYSKNNSHITFAENAKVIFINDIRSGRHYYDNGAIYLKHSHVSFEGNAITLFRDNTAFEGGAIYSEESTISFKENSTTEFTNNIAALNGGSICSINGSISFEANSTTKFSNSQARYNGGAIYSWNSCISFEKNSNAEFSNNKARFNGGTIYARNSSISFEKNFNTEFTNNAALYYGGCIYAIRSYISFSNIEFTSNSARYYGGAIYGRSSYISFETNSTIKFTKNTAIHGGAIYSWNVSISFKENSNTKFTTNNAKVEGGAIYSRDSFISFKENSTTQFTNNVALQSGGSVYAIYGHLSFEDNSAAEFTNNSVGYSGGAILTRGSSLSFGGNSNTAFANNNARDRGGAIYISQNSFIYFKENSNTEFNNNIAIYYSGGTIYSKDSSVSFEKNSTTKFTNSAARYYGGAIYLTHGSISFKENSTTEFINNNAYDGGVIYSNGGSLSFKENSTTEFTNNSVGFRGGAIFSTDATVSFEENSHTEFTNNIAIDHGGAIFSFRSYMYFEWNSTTKFTNNSARKTGGGAVYSAYTTISFKENSTTEFLSNTARLNGGGILSIDGSISFEENSTTQFSSNNAANGGAIYSEGSSISFQNFSDTKFNNNAAISNGGAIYSLDISISSKSNSHIVFDDNAATRGGAVYSINGSVSFEGFSATVFSNNNARDYGGAIIMIAKERSEIIFTNNSTVTFAYNNAPFGETVYCGSNSYITTKEKSTVLFNGVLPKWCTNMLCLPYSGQGAVTIDSSGMVRCSDQIAFACVSENCNCNSLELLLYNHRRRTSNAVVILTGKAILFSYVYLYDLKNVSIIGQDDFTVLCVNGGRVRINSCANLAIVGITWIGCGGYNYQAFSVRSTSILIQESNFLHLRGPAFGFMNSQFIMNQCNFMNNNYYSGHGAAISLSAYSRGTQIINKCDFSYNKGIKSIVFLEDNGYVSLYYNNTTFSNNQGTSIYLSHNCSIHISGDILIQNNTAENGAGIYINDHSTVTFGEKSKIKFINNSVDHNGSAIFMNSHSNVMFEQNSTAAFIDNKGISGTIYSKGGNSNLTYEATSQVIFRNNSARQYIASILINGDIIFKNNAAENGAGIYITDHSTVIFGENSNVKFISNSIDYNGSAIFMNSYSSVTFEQNSTATFDDNKGGSGTIYSEDNSNIIFKATSQVIFNSNSVSQYGAAIYSFDNSHITFTGSSNVTFSNNIVSTKESSKDMKFGGIIFSSTYSHTSFDKNSTIVFSNNKANVGAAIFSFYKSSVTFKDSSKVTFNSNVAQHCGILTSALFSNIVFNDNTNVTFKYNTMSCIRKSSSNYGLSAGAICTLQSTTVLFSGHSLVTFINNTAEQGGAVVFSDSNVTTEQYSKVTFSRNIAEYSNGGAFICFNNSIVTIRGNSNITFNNNKASQSGGAIHSYSMCKITFKDNSTSSFIRNTARDNGGAVLSSQLSEVTFEGNSAVMFDGNLADNGGTLYFTNSTITFTDTSMIAFYNNKARQQGGVGYFGLNSKGIFEDSTTIKFDNNIAEQNAGVLYSKKSKILFKGNSVLTLTHNKATSTGGTLYFDYNSDVLFSQFTNITFDHNSAVYGGAVSANDHSNITVTGNSVLLFVNNEALQSGGTGYFSSYCNVIMEGNAIVMFDSNKALLGGAVCINDKTNLLFKENSTALFYNNLATVGGGATTVLMNSTFTLQNDATINFTNNHAQYGAALFLDASAIMVNGIDNNSINFTGNGARIVGNSIYQDIADLCNRSCLTDRIKGINTEFIATPPNELKFYDPAVCIDNDNDTQCNSYYVQNIMPGSDIKIPACVLDYYNHSVESTQFLVQNEVNSSYIISGPEQVLIGCDMFEGISITSNQVLSKSTNLSVSIDLNVDHNADWKQILVTLIIELSECHPGFLQTLKSQKCECYNANDIVFCSGSSSTIKRGYWFGSVTGRPTVTVCPINYCNFTCCETSNGYYHLSPVRKDQCRSHRSGAACGSCAHEYTLSFDSIECVSVDSCTAGQKVLVILLTVTYWIVMVILVFAVMYYRVGIGYLYCITYYYSIIDILLSQNLQAFRGLYLTVSILSSFSKITPQFLGALCLTTGMSGIDQQFIHYIHPSAVILIIVIISLLARKSSKFTAFISRGIIHVICSLILLSYTSIVSTSLLLMRSLTFHDIDKVYTYLSPDIEYFHGRHLAYGIVALLCSISIALGLPLLLTLQPILNHKFNFVKIKPFLDQFQGCYKDSYRCFAGYYMICRLVIITIVIANSSNEAIVNYVLIVACGIIALIHLIVKPYSNEILNKFDGVVLFLIVFFAVLSLLDDFDSPLVITIAFLLVVLPLTIFLAITMYLHKDELKKTATRFILKSQILNKNKSNTDINNNIPIKEFDHIIDDGVRENAKVTICGM